MNQTDSSECGYEQIRDKFWILIDFQTILYVLFLETKPDWQFHRAVDVVSIKRTYWNCNNIWESIKSHLFWHNYYSSTRFNQNQTAFFLSQLKIEQNLEKKHSIRKKRLNSRYKNKK